MGDGGERSGRCLWYEAFQLGEDLLDRIEIGRVFGQEQKTRGCGPDGVSHGFAFVRSQIVEHDDVVALEGRDEELFDIGEKPLAVDGAVEQAGRFDAVVAQRSQEGRGFPVAVRDLGDEPAAARRPAVGASCWSWSRACPRESGGFVDEHQTRRIDALLMASPAHAMAFDVRPILLARDQRLFLSVTPIRRKNRLIIDVSALTPRAASNRWQRACRVMSDFPALSASRNVSNGSLPRSQLLGSWLPNQTEGTIPSIPNRQSVTIRVQMRVVESSRILQPESKHSIKADVSDPDEGERYNRRAIRPERVTSQHQWPHVGVDGIVRDRSYPNVGDVADHREIRQKKQQGKLKPTALAPMVREEADDNTAAPSRCKSGRGFMAFSFKSMNTRIADRS